MDNQPIMQQIVLFDVGPLMTQLGLKYGYFMPYSERQNAIFSEYFVESLSRIYGLITVSAENTEYEYLMKFGHWTLDELRLIHDNSLDLVLTSTVTFEMLARIKRYLYFTTKLSSTTLIIEGF